MVGAPGTGPSALGWVWKTSALASGSSEQPRWVHSGGKRKRLEPVQDKPGLWVSLCMLSARAEVGVPLLSLWMKRKGRALGDK